MSSTKNHKRSGVLHPIGILRNEYVATTYNMAWHSNQQNYIKYGLHQSIYYNAVEPRYTKLPVVQTYNKKKHLQKLQTIELFYFLRVKIDSCETWYVSVDVPL
jgi:hypothetical protein